MSLHDIVTTEEARGGFYPTPRAVADRLLEDLSAWSINSILEPSAGKGDLIRAFASKYREEGGRFYSDNARFGVDAVEIDPYLRSILSYEFGGQKRSDIYDRIRSLEDAREYDRNTHNYTYPHPGQAEEYKALKDELDLLKAVGFHIVHDDFLTMETRKQYDLILMNPPFHNGDAHLLKAIEMQKKGGGQIRCILNAETLRNPYTNRRQLLARELAALDAEVEFVDNAFSDAERETDVSVALIKIKIPEEKHESTIYERLRKAERLDELEAEEVTDMAVSDFMEQIVTRYNVELDAGLELIREYNALKPYIADRFDTGDKFSAPTLTLCVGDPRNQNRGEVPKINRFVELTRKKYWEALFTNKEFTSQLTSNLRDKYRKTVDKMQAYDFTLFNIQQVMTEMNAEMSKGIQDTIVALFDRMTVESYWCPEMTANKHYYSGWATNKAHKINSKVILPVSGSLAEGISNKNMYRLRDAESTISDIEKVFEYLDGNMSAHVDLHGVLEEAFQLGQTRNIQCKFFTVTLYKKGTMHIRFRDQRLVDRFNIYCSQKKNWLPPNYGRTSYADMSKEARDVVDSFNGDGTEGSGAAAYAEILDRKGYFLSEPGSQMLALPGV